jgi:undecaprenyl-diphosphatase
MFDPIAGAVLLVAAVLIAAGRLFIGAHYPADIGGSVLVAAASALLVVRVARPLIAFLVRLVERVTDPILRPIWRRA